MKTWTTQAERRLDEYLLERVAREELHGEEAAELKEDLRRHVYEEAEHSREGTVGLMQLETILGGMDAGYRPMLAPPSQLAAAKSKRARTAMWTFGVVLPALVLGFEAVASFCGGVFFNPIPTWWHFVLLAMVPAINAWLLNGAPRGGESGKGAAAGMAVVIAAFYGLLFIPLIPLSLLALIFFGLGMVSLTPVFAWWMTWKLGRTVRKESIAPRQFRNGWLAGAAAALLGLVILEGPAVWTRANLAEAVSERGNAEAAIARLRAFHSERTLLQACYEGNRGMMVATDIAGWMSKGWRVPLEFFGATREFEGVDTNQARDIFFRVTGKPFNSLKPPNIQGARLAGRSDPMGEFEFDENLGGDEVAVRLKSLDLKESRFDGHLDSASQIGYGEWTMVFHNRSRNAQEARCQVRLPEGGRVSRLTLWVNGEPREAAFSSVSKVKAAYKAIAVVQRKDPVLVTMSGPDTVLVQCFPVPAQGEMKIRFGVTAPVKHGRWELPRIVERNFGTLEGLEHSVWLQGDDGFSLVGNGVDLPAVKDGEGKSLSAALPVLHAVGQGVAVMTAPLTEEPGVVWCEDKFAVEAERILVREPRRVKSPGAAKVVMVLDGSAAMAAVREELVQALDDGVIAILADDKARRVGKAELSKYTFSGGRDNEPALREALRISKEQGGLPVVWVHGPQAMEVSQTEALLQVLERGTVLPLIHAVEAVSGPNRLAQAVFRSGALKRGPRLDGTSGKLTAFLAELREGKEETRWTWRRAALAEGLPGKQVWDHLARLWAMGIAEDPAMQIAEAARPEIAARYQLVTLVSGAVVLETMEQFAEHGLTPVDADAAPHVPTGVPEPTTSLLLMIGAAAALLRRQRAA